MTTTSKAARDQAARNLNWKFQGTPATRRTAERREEELQFVADVNAFNRKPGQAPYPVAKSF